MKTLILILFLSSTLIAFGQSNYSKYIVADSVGKTEFVKHKDGDEKITYLGVIKKQNSDTLYYVIITFRRVQAAIVMHGHSDIIFLNRDYKEAKSYELGLPEELPYKLVNNVLYFKYVDEKTGKKAVFKNKIETVLPKMMCISPVECY
jgi:hypothetical protein